jgi:hypothetical protein
VRVLRYVLLAFAALLLVLAIEAAFSPVSIAGSTQIIEDLNTGHVSRLSTGVSCRLPVLDMWNGSHEREATAHGLPPEYCRGHSRSHAGIAAIIATLASGLAALAWAVGRNRREEPARISDDETTA